MKKALLHISILILMLLFLGEWTSVRAIGEEREIPFHNGERISFQVTWSRIPAGEATIELFSEKDLKGEDVYHILFNVRTTPFVDIFYKIRDTIESYMDPGITNSLGYIKQHRGRSQQDVIVDFDWTNQQAQYSSNGNKKPPISIVPGTFDPLSVFFAFRMHDLEKEAQFSVPVTDGKKILLGKADVIRRETIKVAGVTYDTFLVEPEMGEIGGVFEKSKDAKLQIWVTSDKTHIPVRIKSKVAVGSFIVELTSYDKGDTD